jgi:hypothetical protein
MDKNNSLKPLSTVFQQGNNLSALANHYQSLPVSNKIGDSTTHLLIRNQPQNESTKSITLRPVVVSNRIAQSKFDNRYKPETYANIQEKARDPYMSHDKLSELHAKTFDKRSQQKSDRKHSISMSTHNLLSQKGSHLESSPELDRRQVGKSLMENKHSLPELPSALKR